MKIGIIGAMEEELSLIRAKIENATETRIANQLFIEGSIKDKQVVLSTCGIGKVNAAIGATLINQLYSPNYLINVGSAGGFGSDINIGDIVLSTEVRYHDVDLTDFGYEFGQAAKLPASYTPDPDLLEIARRHPRQLISHQIHEGLILSGDSFLGTPQHFSAIKKQFPGVKAAEMELCAIAHVCFVFKTPFLAIKTISDTDHEENNKEAHEKWLQLATENATSFITYLLEAL